MVVHALNSKLLQAEFRSFDIKAMCISMGHSMHMAAIGLGSLFPLSKESPSSQAQKQVTLPTSLQPRGCYAALW